jgi:hypothetical protein
MPCNDRDKLLYNIRELPEIFNIEPVDLFVVETLDGTSIIAWDNMIIDLSQTSFEEPFNNLITNVTDISGRLAAVESATGVDPVITNRLNSIENSIGDIDVPAVLDDDSMTSASRQTVPTSLSVKNYVDNNINNLGSPTLEIIDDDTGYEISPTGLVTIWGKFVSGGSKNRGCNTVTLPYTALSKIHSMTLTLGSNFTDSNYPDNSLSWCIRPNTNEPTKKVDICIRLYIGSSTNNGYATGAFNWYWVVKGT